MAKTKIDKDDIKRLVENTSNPSSTTSVYSAKYVDDNFLKEITKEAIEEVLTGDITSHDHDTTYLGKADPAVDSAKLGGELPSYYEPAFTKNTAFNKTFGTGSSDVAKGDHGHSDLHSHNNKTILDAISASFTTDLKSNYDTAYTHSQSTHAPADALTNRTIKVESLDKLGSATTNPLNFKSGDGLINIEGHVNSGILDIIFSSVNTLAIYGDLDPQDLREAETGVHELKEGNLYYFTPNPVCGTDIKGDSLFGKLIILENIDGTSKTLYYHSYRTNKIYVCSGYDNGSAFVWSNWERLLTCLDTTDVIEQEGEEYVFTLERNNTEIYIPSGKEAFDSEKDTIVIDVSNIIIGGRSHFKVYFSVPITGIININIETNDSNPINYSSFYVDPTTIPSSQINSGIEYIVWRYPTYWYISNRIF